MFKRFIVLVKGYREHHKYPFGSYASERKKDISVGAEMPFKV
jgi:hypothetical protein